MNVNSFFLYFVLPAFTLFLIFTNRYYYTKKESQRMRFNMREDLFFGNIVGPIVGLLVVLAIYAAILNIQFVTQLRWELLAIFTITTLSLLVGIGLGGHIAAVSIEKSMKKKQATTETEHILYFFHWPFGHKLTYIPAALVFYILVLLDLFKGVPEDLKNHQLIILTFFAFVLGAVATVSFIMTHVTRIMFYTSLIIDLSLLIVLTFESITLANHTIAYFFTVMFFSILFLVAVYRYSYYISDSLHLRIHSKFINGDKVKEG